MPEQAQLGAIAMAKFILSVIGSDRPGLTQALARAVLEAGANWLESHLVRLGGTYVGSILVELETGRVEALRVKVGKVDEDGLDVRIAEMAPHKPTPEGVALNLTLVGQDHMGIVERVTSVVSDLGVNVERLDTRLSSEPHSGGRLFHMDVDLRLPAHVTTVTIQEALEAISAEIMVDVAIQPTAAC